MNIREKIGILGLRPASAGPQVHGGQDSPSAGTSGTKAERQAAALQLWNKWANEALGPMSADPTPEELTRKSRRVQRLENECAAMAARAQRRLEMSAALRSQPIFVGSSSAGNATARSDGGGVAGMLRTGAFSREAQYAVRERRKAAAYAAARAEGEAEAEALAAALAPAAAAVTSFKSRNMLDSLITTRAISAGGGVPVGGVAKPTGHRARPQSAMPLHGAASAAGASGRSRPRSAVPNLILSRQPSLATSSTGATGGPSRTSSLALRAGGSPTSPAAAGMVAVPEGEYFALRQEIETISERLAATQAALEVQTDTEAQLREALDLLRARLHSSGLREVEAQRRLAQHSKLEPLFDRLAETFTFSSPEEVAARLEFLEDDKLGTFDQLLRTQEEVTRLQQRLMEAQKAGETVATRLTTEHLQGSARLQQQNEQLRQELEALENQVHRLTARQAQLVALQTAVLQLWGKLTEDPDFADAFGDGPRSPRSHGSPRRRTLVSSSGGGGASPHSHAGGGEEGGGAAGGGGGSGGIALSDPLSMLHMIEEFVTAKSEKLAIRHFTDIQRVANHVWQQHFRNRADIRGRVVPTFEQLSTMADRMADRVRSVQEQAGRSQEAEKNLMREVKRLQQQKRVLEGELARRDEQLKSIMGVPRKERPATANAALNRILRSEAVAAGPSATTSAGGAGGAGVARALSRATSIVSTTGSFAASSGGAGPGGGGSGGRGGRSVNGDADSASVSSSAAGGALQHRSSQQHQSPPPQQQQQQQQHRPRAASMPAANGGATGSITSSSPSRTARNSAASAATATSCGTLAPILSPAVALQVPQMTSDLPYGAHWRQYVASTSAGSVQRAAPQRLPAGSLFYNSSRGGAAEAAGGSSGGAAVPEVPAVVEEPPPPSVRWAAPQRSAIEQAFLTRLERRTRVT
ncbi:hypothetical protein Agub_g341 [Astrephomene gubernaculifera]|uniref:Uncharacterized protein n=1 Tax=Astrephomene gubernaculifera TaxID=47775 RepID=A0AAD3HGT6_9CHLO|nr:hypothetical protein Agub_g341 [Astrephomene gubernaculifera]